MGSVTGCLELERRVLDVEMAHQAQQELSLLASPEQLEQFRIRYLGAKGAIKDMMAQLAQVRVSAASFAASTAYEDYQRQLGILPPVETPRQLLPAAETSTEQAAAPPTIEQTQ